MCFLRDIVLSPENFLLVLVCDMTIENIFLGYICGAYSEFTSDVLPHWRPGYDVRQERLLYIFHYFLISSTQDFP
jgi:hypothetical protein